MEENKSPFEPFDNKPSALKQRHGCVTAWLILLLTANVFSSITYVFNSEELQRQMEISIPPMMLLLMGFLSIGNVIFAVMLLQWKKIGFYGFAITTVVSFGLNIVLGMSLLQSIAGLFGIGILYAILQFQKGGKSAWRNLE